jgi:hypothetical protein
MLPVDNFVDNVNDDGADDAFDMPLGNECVVDADGLVLLFEVDDDEDDEEDEVVDAATAAVGNVESTMAGVAVGSLSSKEIK